MHEAVYQKMWPVSCLILLLIFTFHRLWNKLPKLENIPSIAIDSAVLSPNVTFVRWKAHQDWVTQVTFYLSISIQTSPTHQYI